MHVGVALVTDSEAAEVVQVSEAALHDPALAAEAGAVCCSPSGDHGRDPESPQEPAVLVVVIAAVGRLCQSRAGGGGLRSAGSAG